MKRDLGLRGHVSFLTEPPSESGRDRPHSPLLHTQASSFLCVWAEPEQSLQAFPRPQHPSSAEIRKGSGRDLRAAQSMCEWVCVPPSLVVCPLSRVSIDACLLGRLGRHRGRAQDPCVYWPWRFHSLARL